jgi:phosphatidylserine decarboxylase
MVVPIASKIYGLFQKGEHSKSKAYTMAKSYGIDTSDLNGDFHSFSDFIIRKRLSTEFDAERNHLIAPADSCVLTYTIDNGGTLSVKGRLYTLSRLLKDDVLAREYEGGTFLVFRLRVYDYHRFCFIDDGVKLSHKRVSGLLDSVNMSATGKCTLFSNCREISLLQTTNFGNIVFVEVGAMLVGKIVQTHDGTVFRKGDEKGYFELGGSSIVILLKKDAVQIDSDILDFSAKGIETKVELGERIGKRRA